MSNNISSQQDVMKLVFNVTRFEMQYPRFIEGMARKIIDEEILQPIKTAMASFGYSQKIIDGTTIENLFVDDNGFIQFDVVSDYKSESGFDVAKAREEGTRGHFIKPKNAKALVWIVGGFVKAFSKGHWVKGITKSNIIKKTTEARFPIAQERITQESIIFFNRTVSE
jgi:hypothetical protein